MPQPHNATAAQQGTLSEPATTDSSQTKRVLLTGTTGFLGQAVLQSLLESNPDMQLTALVRPRGTLTGRTRLERLLRKPVFSSWAERTSEAAVAEALAGVEVIEADMSSFPPIDFPVDVVIHSASSVSFDLPIDEAFRTNVGGARNLYQALLDSGQSPHVIHVSTAYVGGVTKGIHREGPLVHDVDWRAEYDAAMSARDRVEAESRTPEALNKVMQTARQRRGRMGPKTVASSAESGRLDQISQRLSDFGRTRAESVGWTDVYTFTKAMAERVAEDMWADAGHRVSFVRPSIIESALHQPFEGWIDGFKVADPLIMAYGRGMLPEFPGLADSILDIIPVDMVVNVINALATQDLPYDRERSYYHVVSGSTNPLPFHRMVSTVRDFFTEHPIPGDDGTPIRVPEWNFPNAELVEKRFQFKELSTSAGKQLTDRLPATKRTRAWSQNLRRTASELSTIRQYSDLYRQYTKTEMIFDDSNTRALRERLPAEFLSDHDFDAAEIDWKDYFQRVHLPAITNLTRVYSRPITTATPAKKPAAPAIKPTDRGLAVFDLDGTVIASNIVQQYMAVVRATYPKWKWPLAFSGLLASVPGFMIAESRDRAELIRMVNRKFRGTDAGEIRRLVRAKLGDSIIDSIRPEARQVIDEHHAAGYRTVLVTGALELLVEPLTAIFDDVVATSMDVTEKGVLSGYLATSPVVDEARANWLRSYAELHDADLSESYGYGDSLADAAWLELVGRPVVVAPDLGLHEIAQKKRWRVVEW